MDDSVIGLIIFVLIVVVSAIKSIAEKLSRSQQPGRPAPDKEFKAPAQEVRRFLREVQQALGEPAPSKPAKAKRRRRRQPPEEQPEPAAPTRVVERAPLRSHMAEAPVRRRMTVADLERKLPKRPLWRAIVFSEVLGPPLALRQEDRFAQ